MLEALATYLPKVFTAVRRRAIYPAGPFVTAPALVVGLILAELGSPGVLSPTDAAVRLELPTVIATGSAAVETSATLLVVPPQEGSAYFPFIGEAPGRVWLSEGVEQVQVNRDSIVLRHDGLSLRSPWLGVTRPLAVFIENAAVHQVQRPGEEPSAVESLQLGSARTTWIALGAILGALFGLGYSSSLAKDGAAMPRQNTRGDDRDKKSQDDFVDRN